MFGLTPFQLTILFIVTLFFVSGMIGRICMCIEKCAEARCMEQIYKNNPGMNVGDISKMAKEVRNNVGKENC